MMLLSAQSKWRSRRIASQNLEPSRTQPGWEFQLPIVFWVSFCLTPSSLIKHFSKEQSGALEQRLNWFRMIRSDTLCWIPKKCICKNKTGKTKVEEWGCQPKEEPFKIQKTKYFLIQLGLNKKTSKTSDTKIRLHSGFLKSTFPLKLAKNSYIIVARPVWSSPCKCILPWSFYFFS